MALFAFMYGLAIPPHIHFLWVIVAFMFVLRRPRALRPTLVISTFQLGMYLTFTPIYAVRLAQGTMKLGRFEDLVYAIYMLVSGLVLAWRWWRERELNPSLRFYRSTYCWFAASGPIILLGGILYASPALVANGIADMVPPLVVLIIGRDKLFTFTARRFERQQAERDGAFLSELLETSASVQVGDPWYLHRDSPDDRYKPFDPLRNWAPGVVTDVNDSHFIVLPLVDGGGGGSTTSPAPRKQSFHAHNAPPTAPKRKPSLHSSPGAVAPAAFDEASKQISLPDAKPAAELLQQARENLRCVRWEDMSLELFSKSSGDETDYALSRPAGANGGLTLDFFLSHSWHDDPAAKWAKLTEIAEEFRRRNGRYPNLWLDKTCISQTEIGNGLRVLPVNVMAARKVLVLAGSTCEPISVAFAPSPCASLPPTSPLIRARGNRLTTALVRVGAVHALLLCA